MAEYIHPDDKNLKNLHKSMEYDAGGRPIVRTKASFGGTAGDQNDSPSIDAFGRLRTGEPYTLFDSTFRYGDDRFKWDSEIVNNSGNCSVSSLLNESSMALQVGTSLNDRVTRETKKVFSYQPGKSLLAMQTFVMAPPQTGLVQRVGYYGERNGIFVEQTGNVVNIVKRTYISGSVQEERIAQQNWSVDTLDGTGTSAIILDMTKAQIFWCDIEWLGVGSVRCGFVINGVFRLVHIFHHANIEDTAYMTTASLPVRYEIFNTTATASNAVLRQICATVISEGGYNLRSISRTVSTALTGVSLSETEARPLTSIRLKTSELDSIVVPQSVDLYGLQQAAFKWQIILNPTLTGATWLSAGPESSVETDLTSTALTGGDVIAEGIFVGGNKGGAITFGDIMGQDFSLQLGRYLNGTSDILTLAAIATTNNDDAVGSLTWMEHL